MAAYYHDDWNIDEEDNELEVEEKSCYCEESIIKAANLIILREIWKYMKAGKVEAFYKLLGISEKTARNIIRGYNEEKKQYMINGIITTRKIRFPGDKWDYKFAAEKLGMDSKVFSGGRLLQINGSITTEIQKIYINEVRKKEKEIDRADYVDFINHKLKYTSEKVIWKYILNFRTDDEKIEELKEVMLNDMRKQIDENKFNDEQIKRFCTYIYKNVRN